MTFVRVAARLEAAGCKRFQVEHLAVTHKEYQRASCWNDNADIDKEVLRLATFRVQNHEVHDNSSSVRAPGDVPTKMVHVFRRDTHSIFH